MTTKIYQCLDCGYLVEVVGGNEMVVFSAEEPKLDVRRTRVTPE